MTDSNTNVIKSIVESTCPHCQKQIYIESQFHPAVVGEVFTREKMDEAKKECVDRVQSLTIDDDKKKHVIDWILDEATVFGPGEVDSIILSLLKPE
jgi:hypothetical protein